MVLFRKTTVVDIATNFTQGGDYMPGIAALPGLVSDVDPTVSTTRYREHHYAGKVVGCNRR